MSISDHHRIQAAERIRTLQGLPVLPAQVTMLLAVLESEKSSVGDLAAIIRNDIALAAKVLQMANSASYGFNQTIHDLDLAVTLLGMKEIGQLALGLTIINVFQEQDTPEEMDWLKFWRHSVATGHLAVQLNAGLKLPVPVTPFTAGLLHDIGKLVLYILEPAMYLEVHRKAQLQSVAVADMERRVFGMDHMEAGGTLAKAWNLPWELSEAICYYTEPEKASSQVKHLAALIGLADLAANLRGFDFGQDYIHIIISDTPIWQHLAAATSRAKDFDLERFMMSIIDEIESIHNTTRIALQ